VTTLQKIMSVFNFIFMCPFVLSCFYLIAISANDVVGIYLDLTKAFDSVNQFEVLLISGLKVAFVTNSSILSLIIFI